jgi:hypothetical protein
MKRIVVLTLLCLLIPAFNSDAQQLETKSINYDAISAGLGLGLDFGGIGGNFLVYPAKNFGFFAGAGYALAGIGMNGGIKVRQVPDNPEARVSPFLLAMYGYNAAIKVEGATELNKIFYGPTVGLGCDFRGRNQMRGYWSAALLIPFRRPEVDEYIKDLKNNHGVVFNNELLPIGFTISYRFFLDI